ncbi:MAG: molybdopterin-dependent oxidoreductase [Coriobacteriales bacterium]
MSDRQSEEVEYFWGETNGQRYRRGTRLPRREDKQTEIPAVEMKKLPWKWEEDGMTVIRGTARSAPGCHNVCGILTYVKDGKVVKVEGDPEDPYNQGRLCSRCLCIPDYIYHDERLLYPMKRKREDRGKDRFERISWDEAYDIIVEEFKRISDTYGSETIMMCQGTGRDIHQITRLNACIGSPNEGVPYFAGNSCYLPRISSMACMLGDACVMDCSQFLPDRYDDPRYVVPEYCIIWGHQPFYSNADGFYGHWITDLMKRGMKVAVVDPQLTWIAARAGKDWLRVRPGGDGALAMAMLKVICDEKLYDADFCDKWVYGLEAVCGRVAQLDLDELCERAWVPKEDVVRVARTYATSKPAAIQWGVALDQQTGGQQAAHAVVALWTITGNLDVPGGNVIGRACWGIEQPNWVGNWGYDELITPEEHLMRIGVERYPMFGAGFKVMSSNATIEAWQTGDPYKPKAAYFATNNFLATMGAQAEKQLEWYKELEFVVVEDLFMTPTMMALADVVLPAATYAERDGFGGLNPYRISCINKAIEPVGDTKADNTIFLELGKRLTDAIRPQNADIAYPWDDVQEMWDYALEDGGFTWQELREATWKYPEFQYRKYETGGLRNDGSLGFQTETGRAEVYSMVFHHTQWSGLDPLPSYVEPAESPYSAPEDLEEYPYIVTSGARVPHFFHSEQRQVKKLRALHPDPLCYIHPQTAAKHGIADGDWMWLENKHGKCKYKASYNESYDPRVMQCEHGWWFPERKDQAEENLEDEKKGLFGTFESNINNLVPFDAGVSGFGANYKAMMCRIYKA